MFESLKSLTMRLLKVPPEPAGPAGAQDSLQVFRAAPGYYSYKLAVWLVSRMVVVVTVGLPLAVAGVFGLGLLGEEPLAGGLLLLLSAGGLAFLGVVTALGYAALRLDYELRWYKVTDRALRIREGVYNVREMTLTFANIQNISVSQGPLQRHFGISDLVVQTAGGGGVPQGQTGGHFGMHLGVFRGVDNAEEIRTLMLDRLRALKDSGLGDEEAEGRGPAGSLASGQADALRAVRDEARALRAAAEAR